MTNPVHQQGPDDAAHLQRHPLDPLDEHEMRSARDIARTERGLADTALFAIIRLQEPPKDVVRGYKEGDPLERRAFVVVMDRRAGTLHDGVVSVTAGQVVEWHERPGLQGPILMDDFNAVNALIRADARWQTAVRRRGVSDLEKVRIDPWMIGNFGAPEEQGRRVAASLCYYVEFPDDNPYARPIEGVVAYVDLNASEVMRVIDVDEVIPIPEGRGRYDSDSVGAVRDDLKPLDVVQPDGPSFEVRGHEIRWQRWRFRFSFNAREGLVLHTIGYEDDGELRPIIYRASLSEMIVPYGDISPSHFFQHAFDLGEFGVGKGVNSLELGCDCLGEIRYFDAVLHDDSGEPVTVRNAICLHEEDASILWKHWDFPDGQTEVRRSRRLVISSISTNLNYEYGYYWYFYQDGTIEYDVKLTGILQTAAVSPDTEPSHAVLVAPGLSAPHHQHLFNVRLDMEVDGPQNTVSEVDLVAAPPGPQNPFGSAMVTTVIPLTRESEARRTTDPAAGRTWIVSAAARRNDVGQLTGYRLIPMYTPTILAPPDTAIGRRGAFARHNLWVTPFDPEERHAGGEYPNQHPGGDGLPTWSRADRPIENTDIVVWHTFGISHVARPEDWPVMPVEHVGFIMKPWGFFSRNPALDVPRSILRHCH